MDVGKLLEQVKAAGLERASLRAQVEDLEGKMQVVGKTQQESEVAEPTSILQSCCPQSHPRLVEATAKALAAAQDTIKEMEQSAASQVQEVAKLRACLTKVKDRAASMAGDIDEALV